MAKRKPETNGDHLAAPVPVDDPPPRNEPRSEDSEPERKLPVHVVRYGAIKANVWANYGDDGSVRYGVTFCRLYRTTNPETGEECWASSYSYGPRDLPLLEKVAAACFEWIAQQHACAEVPF